MRSRMRAGSTSRFCVLAGAGLLCLLSISFLGAAQEPPPVAAPVSPSDGRSPLDLRREYRQRQLQLEADDLDGHYALAEWCSENRLYESLLRQARYVLQLDPDHPEAQALYRLAVERLRGQNRNVRPGDGQPETDTFSGELLTRRQIQKLKFAEFLDAEEFRPLLPNREGARAPRLLRGRRGRPTVPVPPRVPPGERITGRLPATMQEEFLQVRFDGEVLNDFLDRMSGAPDFSTREDRVAFLTLSPTRQVQLIRQYTGNAFQERIQIVNDPLVFRQFERVLPIVMSGCGTTACHGGPGAEGWRLRTARPRTDLNLYTNFLILNRVQRDHRPLVNRGKPEDSLLVQYGLPPQMAAYQHPQEISPAFPSGFDDLRYQTVLTWIESLSLPAPRTGVELPGYPEPPPPQIGGKPAPDQDETPADR